MLELYDWLDSYLERNYIKLLVVTLTSTGFLLVHVNHLDHSALSLVLSHWDQNKINKTKKGLLIIIRNYVLTGLWSVVSVFYSAWTGWLAGRQACHVWCLTDDCGPALQESAGQTPEMPPLLSSKSQDRGRDRVILRGVTEKQAGSN